jgi:hypothetical protein
LVVLIATAALAGGGALAASVSAVPAAVPVGYRVEAALRPFASAVGSGEFTAMLVRTEPPMVTAPETAEPLQGALLPAGCKLISSPKMSTVPDRIKCGLEPAFPLPKTGVHWLLVWRLTHTGPAGSASAVIETIPAAEGVPPAIVAKLCNNCPRIVFGHLALDPARATALLGGNAYALVSSAAGELRGRVVTLSPSAPTLLSFGRSGGNILPFKATVGSDGLLQISGPGWSGRTGKIVPAPIRNGLLALAQAERFYTMPVLTQCPGALPDTPARFLTISTGTETRTVTVHGSCNQPFEDIYAVFQAAILGPSITG